MHARTHLDYFDFKAGAEFLCSVKREKRLLACLPSDGILLEFLCRNLWLERNAADGGPVDAQVPRSVPL